MTGVDVEVFQRRLLEAGKQLEHAARSGTGLLQSLEKVELCLSMVKQIHGRPMFLPMRRAMRPSKNTLVQPHILRHQDSDVRLLVLNCLSQITKITAPKEPYNDDVMKEILELIVESFRDLGEMNSPSFARRFSILKIVEDVQLTTVMVNLELNDLFLEMFKHFLAAVSQHAYSTDVYDSMKRIMGFALDESDDISQELLSVLLINLRREMRDSSPAAHSLAMGVVVSCAEKLRPYLKEKFSSDQPIVCNCVHGYHEIVYDICRHGSQEINVNKYTTPARKVLQTENCTTDPTASGLDNEKSQVTSSPDDHHNEFICEQEKSDKKKSEADLKLVSLFSHIPYYPLPVPDTCGRKRRRPRKRSDAKEEESTSVERAETGSEGVALSEDTVCESANNVSVSKSLKRKRTQGISARKKRDSKELEILEDSWEED